MNDYDSTMQQLVNNELEQLEAYGSAFKMKWFDLSENEYPEW